jgi:2-dehydro-3-deoxygluconokinase
LSLFTPGERMKVTALAEAVRAAGGDVAFDSNYRARGWNDVAAAREAIGGFAKYVTIALPTLDDDRDLFGDTSAERCAQRWIDAGVREVAVKLGADGAYVATREGGTKVAPAQAVTARDTTGAGDSFNAAYLAARFAGQSAEEAAATGNRLAGVVVQQSGAIIRPVLMPVGLIRERSAG